jgi:hypothetical protein
MVDRPARPNRGAVHRKRAGHWGTASSALLAALASLLACRMKGFKSAP